MATNPLIEIRNGRIGKAEALRQLGLNPYPSKSRRTHYAGEILDAFEAHEDQRVTVAGRLMSWRKQGALAFAHVQDQTGRIQLFLRRNLVQTLDTSVGRIGYTETHLLDLGDIVEATGKVIRTQRGEISVLVEELRLLTKSVRPLPDQWSGLKDREQVLRKRYLDCLLEPESFQRFGLICRIVAAIRSFLNQRGFLEFTTPVIQPQYGGGTAKPFKTHVNALGCDMYLAISHELYLKRLIVAGYDKVYTIGRYFRNEGIDRSHHPEFSMVETMVAYENYEYNMDLIEAMFRHVATEVFGRTVFQVKGHEVDFGKPWRRVNMAEAVLEKTGIDLRKCTSVADANRHLTEMGIHENHPSVGEALVKAFEVCVEKTLIQPTLVTGHPIEISPLAKPLQDDPRYVERFEIFIAGMECGDNWSEQNDPVRLLETWREAYRAEERDAGKFHALDFDFIEALEHGMPPTTGIGPGIERMMMIFTGQEHIDDVIFFPMMRPSITPLNAGIYGVEPVALAPMEDLVVSDSEFRQLCLQGHLRPDSHHLTLKPHLRFWTTDQGTCTTAGHVDLEGFQANGLVRLSGYTLPIEEGMLPAAEQDSEKHSGLSADFSHTIAGKLVGHLESGLVGFLKSTFPDCQVTLSPPSIHGTES